MKSPALCSVWLLAFVPYTLASDPTRSSAVELLYENDFRQPEDVNHWTIEGPGRIEWEPGGMTVIPDAQQAVLDQWERVGRRRLHPLREYYDVVRQRITVTRPDMVDELTDTNGRFVGGHIVCWNKTCRLPDDFAIQYDFKPLSPIGLAIVFFAAQGAGGQDIFSSELAPRYGVFKSYTHGDINAYHISYWANHPVSGIRGTSNLRKDAGFYWLATAADPTSRDLDYSRPEFDFPTYRMRIEKRGGEIRLLIDGQLVLETADAGVNTLLDQQGAPLEEKIDTGGVLGGGRFGLRQMVSLKARYSRLRVTSLAE